MSTSFDDDWSRRFEDEWEKWDEANMSSASGHDDDDGKKQIDELETSSMSVDSDYHQGLPESARDDDDKGSSSSSSPPQYSTRELVSALGSGEHGNLPEAIQHRIRDFRLAQRKRRETYGNERPWGILGLYDHLASIRIDLEWAEDAAWRRQHNE